MGELLGEIGGQAACGRNPQTTFAGAAAGRLDLKHADAR